MLGARTRNIRNIITVAVLTRNKNGPYISVQSDPGYVIDTQHNSKECKTGGGLRTAALDKTTTYSSSTAQMDVPLTHDVPYWCWRQRCNAVLCACCLLSTGIWYMFLACVHVREQKTDNI